MTHDNSYSELLFSYGTLQLESVQMSTFGRRLEGHVDQLVGYKLTEVEITDEEVLRKSGERFHPIVSRTGDKSDVVEGTVFKISKQELAEADSYEVDDYKRVLGDFASGQQAWVYVAAKD